MKNLSFIVFLFLLTACKKDVIDPEQFIISIDLDRLSNESLPDLTIKSLIPLETSNASVFGQVSRIEHHNGTIYILDSYKSNAVFAFSEDGAFIGKTKQGKGPGEMTNPQDLYLDKGSNSIYVSDQGARSIFQFDPGLGYISQKPFRNFFPINFAFLDNDRTLVHSHYNMDFVYKIIGPDYETIEQTFVPDMNMNGHTIYSGPFL